MENMLGNILGSLGTYREPHGNLKGTLREHIGNQGKMKRNHPTTIRAHRVN